jgi:amino-acid N-acetyltransferase
MKIRAARCEDLDAIKALLAENELLVADVDARLLVDFLVAQDASGKIVGGVGLERFGRSALLRSLVVARTVRNERLGTVLVTQAETLARAHDLVDLWLLTTTAAEFFRRRGYSDVPRNAAPEPVAASRQFAEMCPASATCMYTVIAQSPILKGT